MTTLRELGQTSQYTEQHLLSVSWKLFLEYLPGLDDIHLLWPEALHKERSHYERLHMKYIIEPSQQLNPSSDDQVSPIEGPTRPISPSVVDLSIHNPLSLAQDSPWQQYFQDNELKAIIQRDVERTFPDQPCFNQPDAQRAITDILFVYCKMHQDTSYRQGMHELLAPLWKAVNEDRFHRGTGFPSDPVVSQDNIIFQVLDARYVDHDAFALFCRIMRVARPWFEVSDVARNASANLRPRTALPGAGSDRSAGGTISDSLRYLKIAELSRATPILAKCNHIFYSLLKRVDPSLFQHLESLEIEPQLYGIRWIRLLWGREFPFDDLVTLWTALFAHDPNLVAVEWVCVAMLIRIRHLLLEGDYSTCLQHIMRYPPLTGPGTAVSSPGDGEGGPLHPTPPATQPAGCHIGPYHSNQDGAGDQPVQLGSRFPAGH
ncbi:rab-GTPase-TBC domain-containing protein [Dimargaris cristalligena]|uniref:Rab-GTPase-TBC domain-containing protein n=1 Tax=Dimargaris cristalligena TaxID=215637 RepID=A0A4P9ZW90_9FUNG|nr:rab-GTPase-TBC domain-containing protein [Dimargaris cristalligena]|eukprot:RKP37221.1 rab-GTPase-TBC domain-containing protein [Dimargaris cristalligena]